MSTSCCEALFVLRGETSRRDGKESASRELRVLLYSQLSHLPSRPTSYKAISGRAGTGKFHVLGACALQSCVSLCHESSCAVQMSDKLPIDLFPAPPQPQTHFFTCRMPASRGWAQWVSGIPSVCAGTLWTCDNLTCWVFSIAQNCHKTSAYVIQLIGERKQRRRSWGRPCLTTRAAN